MHTKGLFLPLVAALIGLVPVLPAQQHMTELGGFAQYNKLDPAWQASNGTWAGLRVGRYLTDRLETEFDGSWGSIASQSVGGSMSDYMMTMRVTQHVPFYFAGIEHQLLLGVGVGTEQIGGAGAMVLSPDVGMRFSSPRTSVSLRVDGLVNWSDRRNTVGFLGSRSNNFLLRAGLSYTLFEHLHTRPIGSRFAMQQPRAADTMMTAVQQGRSDSTMAAARRQRDDSVDAARRADLASRERHSADSVAEVERMRTHDVAVLAAPVTFDFARASIRADQRARLDAKLAVLRGDSSIRVRIQGFTDSRGPAAYNKVLGLRRAQAVRRYLAAQGVDVKRMEVESMGEERPLCTEHTASCYARNRRTEYVINAGDAPSPQR